MSTPVEVYTVLKQVDQKHGGNNVYGRIIGTAIVLRESGGNAAAFRDQSKNPGGGNDRGWWQFNDKAHPEVTPATAFNPTLATEEAYRVSEGFHNWHDWAGAPLNPADFIQGLTAASTSNDNITGLQERFMSEQITGGGEVGPLGVGGLGSVTDTVTDWASGLTHLLANLVSVDWWKRVGLGALGVVIIIFGLIVVFGKDATETVTP